MPSGVLALIALSGGIVPPFGTVVIWVVFALDGRGLPAYEILRCLRVQLACVLGMAVCQGAALAAIALAPTASEAVHRNIAAWGALAVLGLWGAIPVVSGVLLATDRR